MVELARQWKTQALAALLLALLTELARRASQDPAHSTLLWPSAALGAVFLARWGWRGLFPLVGGLLGAALLALDLPLAQRLGGLLAGLVGPLALALALGPRWRLRRGSSNPFEVTASLGRLVATQALLAAPLAALVATAAAALAGRSLLEPLLDRWVNELAGFLTLAPLAWELMSPRRDAAETLQEMLRQGRRHAGVVLVLAALVATASALWLWPSTGAIAQAATYLLAPLLALCLAGIAPLPAFTTLALAGIGLALGQAHAHPLQQQSPLLVTLFISVVVCAVLAMRALLNGQRQARKQLELQAFIDHPTGLLNRAGMNRLLETWSNEIGGRDRALLSLRAGNLDAIEALGGPQRLAAMEQLLADELRTELPHVRWARVSTLRFVGAVAQLGSAAEQRADLLAIERIAAGCNSRLQDQLHAPQWGVAGLRIASGLHCNTGTLFSALREQEHRALAGGRSQWGQADVATQRELAADAAQGQALRAQLESRNLVVVAQLIQNNVPSRIEGLKIEVLCRLPDPDGRLQPPSSFMPVAVRHGLMPLLDLVVVEQTLAWFAAQPKAFAELGCCGINLSGASLADAGTPERLAQLFQRYQLSPAKFVIEVTENQAIAQLAQGMENLRALRKLGCLIALDDFGTGLATFDYLKRFPVDSIKIDGSFVRSLGESAVDRAIIESIVHVARSMGVRTVAEFVESPRLARLVSELGVDESQGYAISPPQRLEAVFAEVLMAQSVPTTVPSAPLEEWLLAGAR